MTDALLWGLVAGSSLVIGAVIALTACPPPRITGLVLGFGGGTLISAISFELTEEAYSLGGADALTFGLAAGALVFYVGDILVSPRAESGMHGREMPEQDESGRTLLLGALLDGVPESAVLGSTLLVGSGIGVPVLAAIFLSNLPEGIGGASDMRTSGVSKGRILALWTGVALICAASSASRLPGAGRRGRRSGRDRPGVRGRRRPGDARDRDAPQRALARRPRGRSHDRLRLRPRLPALDDRVVPQLVDDRTTAHLGEALVERPGEDLRASALADLNWPPELRAERQRSRAGRLVLGDAASGDE